MKLVITQDTDVELVLTQTKRWHDLGCPEVQLSIASSRRFGGAFLREAASLELLITLLRPKNSVASIKTYLDANSPTLIEDLTELLRSPSAFTAVLYAGEVLDQGNRLIDPQIVLAAINAITARQSNLDELLEAAGRSHVAQVSAYGSKSTLFPLAFYDQSTQGKLVRERFTEFISRGLFSRPGGAHMRLRDFAKQATTPLASLIYEIYDNTDKHALTEVSGSSTREYVTTGSDISTGVRGVFLRSVQVPSNAVSRDDAMMGWPQPVDLSIRDWTQSFSSSQWHFAEITVFDSGPGYAARFLNRDTASISIEEEVAAARDCFAQSKTSSNLRSRGFGLPQVLNILRQYSGVLRVRTGRVALHACFHQRILADKETLDHRLVWHPNDPLPNLNGTVVSAIVPVIDPVQR